MRGTGRDGVIGSGCSGQEPLEALSGKGMARGSDSGIAGGRGGVTSRVAGAPRTMFDSTTTSVGPPIMMRCSILSRRTRIRRRRASTLA
jgi:hypothetical protein